VIIQGKPWEADRLRSLEKSFKRRLGLWDWKVLGDCGLKNYFILGPKVVFKVTGLEKRGGAL